MAPRAGCSHGRVASCIMRISSMAYPTYYVLRYKIEYGFLYVVAPWRPVNM
jgi:hypothetical protein